MLSLHVFAVLLLLTVSTSCLVNKDVQMLDYSSVT